MKERTKVSRRKKRGTRRRGRRRGYDLGENEDQMAELKAKREDRGD